MPHRPIGSRWVVTTDRFVSIRPGNIIRVLQNEGVSSNRVFNETTNMEIRHSFELADNQVRPIEPAAAAPPVFQPEPEERYFVLYKTPTMNVFVFTLWTRTSASDRTTNAHTLPEIQAAVESGTFIGFHVFAVPARGVARWDGVTRDNNYVTIQEAPARRA